VAPAGKGWRRALRARPVAATAARPPL